MPNVRYTNILLFSDLGLCFKTLKINFLHCVQLKASANAKQILIYNKWKMKFISEELGLFRAVVVVTWDTSAQGSWWWWMTDNEPLPGIMFVKRCSHQTTLSYFRSIIGERNDVIEDHHVEQRTMRSTNVSPQWNHPDLNFQFIMEVENYSSAILSFHLKYSIRAW